jgi:hypothetical protein
MKFSLKVHQEPYEKKRLPFFVRLVRAFLVFRVFRGSLLFSTVATLVKRKPATFELARSG